MTIELPVDLRDALRVPPAEQESRLRRELAIRLYEKGLLSFGKARELADLSKWDFYELLAAEGIVRHYDLEELEADLALKRSERLAGFNGVT
jgi:predicted HTH domain antitoxin